MTTIRITQSAVDAAQPGEHDRFLWDTDLPGFGLKISPDGGKVYILQYSRDKRTRRSTIGPTIDRYGKRLAPEDARREAKALLEAQVGWDHENSVALAGLQRGDVEPLVTLLEDTKRSIHPEVRRWVAAMLKGDTNTLRYWWFEPTRRPGRYPREAKAKPNTEPLIQLLEATERPIDPEVRRWLVALLSQSKGDDPISRYWQLKCKLHRWYPPSGRATELGQRYLRIGLLIHRFWHKGRSINVVKKKVAEKLKLSSSTINNAWDDYRAFYLRLRADGHSFVPNLRRLHGRRRRFRGRM